MKKIIATILLLMPTLMFAQTPGGFTIPQGGTGNTAYASGTMLISNGGLRFSAISTTTLYSMLNISAGGVGTTTINGVSASSFTFATSTSGSVTLTIATSTGTLTFIPGVTSGFTIPSNANIASWNAAAASTTALTPAYIRGLFSNTVTGLTYTAATGVTSITAGYGIPTTASSSLWVSGPASATDNAIARFDATTGKLIQNSLVSISDSGNVEVPNEGVVTGPITTITPTVGGTPTRIARLTQINTTDPTKVVIYFHGSGETENDAFTGAGKGIVDKLLSEGYIVASSLGTGNGWGNAASQASYKALYDYLIANYNVSNVYFIGQSMGGLASLNLIAGGTVPKVDGWYGIGPVTNLAAAYANGFSSLIEAAYGFSGGANYASATAGYDPNLLATSSFATVRYRYTSSFSDTTVTRASNTALMQAKTSIVSPESLIITATGPHGDPSGLIPYDVYDFVNNHAGVDVSGNIRSTNFLAPTYGKGLEAFYYPPGGYGQIFTYDRSNSAYLDLYLGSGGNQLVLKSTGNVGVGITTPTSKLHVYDPTATATFTGNQAQGLTITGGDYVTNNHALIGFKSSTYSSSGNLVQIGAQFTNTGTYLKFGTSNSYATGITNTALAITPAGEIGVGTTNPAASFPNSWAGSTVGVGVSSAGTAVVGVKSTSTTGYSFFDQTNNNSKSLLIGTYGSSYASSLFGVAYANNSFMYSYPDSKLTIGTFGNADLTLGTNSSAVMTITGAGNIGIGTTTPDKLLTVSSSGTTTQSIDSTSITKGACLKLKDADGVGYTYMSANNGVITASTLSCS